MNTVRIRPRLAMLHVCAYLRYKGTVSNVWTKMTPPKIAAVALIIGVLLGVLLYGALASDQVEIAPGPSSQVQPG